MYVFYTTKQKQQQIKLISLPIKELNFLGCTQKQQYSTVPEFNQALNRIVQTKNHVKAEFFVEINGRLQGVDTSKYWQAIADCVDIQYEDLETSFPNAEGLVYFNKQEANKSYLPIYVSRELKKTDELMLSILLVHEMQHAIDYVNELESSCYDNEINALSITWEFIYFLNEADQKTILDELYLHTNNPQLALLQSTASDYQKTKQTCNIDKKTRDETEKSFCTINRMRDNLENTVKKNSFYQKWCANEHLSATPRAYRYP